MKTIRLPLAGVHNQRTPSGQAAITAGQDQRFINVTFDIVKNPITGKATLYCSKRPGFDPLSVVSAGTACTGFFPATTTGTVISSFGLTNSTIYDGMTSLGAITGQALFFNETIINGTGHITIRSSDGTAWDYSGGTLTQITDTDFVTTGTTVSNFEFLNGFAFYANADNFIHQSDVNSITAYTSTSKIPVNISPDTLLAIAKQKDYIIGFGSGTTEFFDNRGNTTGSVLSSYSALAKKIGIQHQRSLAYLGDDIYFASSTIDGDTKMRKLSGGQITPISTAAEDKILGTAVANNGRIYVSAFQLGGYSYVLAVVTSSVQPTDKLLLEDGFYFLLETGDKLLLEGGENVDTGYAAQLLYNIELNIWCEWSSNLLTWVKGIGNTSTNQVAIAGRLGTTGKIYTINPSSDVAYTDDGTAYSMIIQTSKVDHGNDLRKWDDYIDLIADTESSGTCLLEASDDDYKTWQTLGTFDMTQQQKRIYRCGSYKNERAYRLTHSSNAPFRAQAIDIAVRMGTT